MTEHKETWIFASGSLMWEPGFGHVEVRQALLKGYQRSFCVYSLYAWGTHEHPGLVLGLLPGGLCHGLALRIRPEQEKDVLAYLDDRESAAYKRIKVNMEIAEQPTGAYTYIANSNHPQFAGTLSLEQATHFIKQGKGHRGTSREYLTKTVHHLNELGIRDPQLHHLMMLVETNS
jgi:cation transport protein ChaC